MLHIPRKSARAVAEPAVCGLAQVNGVRITAEDAAPGLVRAPSDDPALGIVAESPVSGARIREMFAAADGASRAGREVGAHNQTF